VELEAEFGQHLGADQGESFDAAKAQGQNIDKISLAIIVIADYIDGI
jgi:hypothetical protein